MGYVLRRLGFYAVAAWAALTLNFIIPRLMPGDPASAIFARFRGQLRPRRDRSPQASLRFYRRAASPTVFRVRLKRRTRQLRYFDLGFPSTRYQRDRYQPGVDAALGPHRAHYLVSSRKRFGRSRRLAARRLGR